MVRAVVSVSRRRPHFHIRLRRSLTSAGSMACSSSFSAVGSTCCVASVVRLRTCEASVVRFAQLRSVHVLYFVLVLVFVTVHVCVRLRASLRDALKPAAAFPPTACPPADRDCHLAGRGRSSTFAGLLREER